MEQQLAEINALKALPLGISIPSASHSRKAGPEVCSVLICDNPIWKTNSICINQQNFHGLVQRLVQKEKQVLQLQAEVDRYNAQKPAEDKEAVSSAILNW